LGSISNNLDNAKPKLLMAYFLVSGSKLVDVCELVFLVDKPTLQRVIITSLLY